MPDHRDLNPQADRYEAEVERLREALSDGTQVVMDALKRIPDPPEVLADLSLARGGDEQALMRLFARKRRLRCYLASALAYP